MSATLRCDALACRIDGTTILRDLDLHVPAGSMTTVVGPSGAGKTTLLRAIAGLAPVSAGTVTLGGADLVRTPVHRRRLAVVFQDPRLFQMSVRDNVAFALRMAGIERSDRRRRADDLLEEVGLGGTGGRTTRGLSGGEAQRVALARALAGDPDLLLLDEPLSAVDPARRDGLRRLIAQVQRHRSVTTLYVTHDRAEAAALGDRVALLLEGRIVQHAPPRDVFERPATPVVARFFGATTLVTGTVSGGRLRCRGVDLPVEGPDRTVTVALRPEHLELVTAGAHGGAGTLTGVVTDVTYRGGHHRLGVDLGDLAVTADVVGDPPRPGEPVRLAVDPSRVWVLPETPSPRHAS